MENKHKEFYEAPLIHTILVAQEGIICTSGGTEDFGEGGSYGEGDFS